MSLFEAFILGIVQGAAEFLPISSSGHLVLVPWWLGWDTPSLLFSVAVHVGTTLAVLAYFWRDWLGLAQAGLAMLRKRRITEPDERLLVFILLATIPAGIVGLLLDDYFEEVFAKPPIVALLLFVTAGLLVASEKLSQAAAEDRRDVVTLSDAIVIGLAQACAIMPGISRSGSTIAAGLFRNLSREEAARFSFLISTPIILAAGAKSVLDLLTDSASIEGGQVGALGLGLITSTIVGYACIALLLNFIRRRRLYPFAIYCVVFGALSLFAYILRG